MNQYIEEPQPKKRSCCIILFVFMALFVVLGIIGIIKYHKTFGSIISFFHNNAQQTQHAISAGSSFSISGKIFFIKDKNIWLASGSSIQQVTFSHNIDEVSVAADGIHGIFTRLDPNFGDLFTINLQTNDISQLTHNKAIGNIYNNIWAVDPAISADSSKILYLSDKAKFGSGISDLEVYQMSLATGSSSSITQAQPSTGGDQDPVFYPLDNNFIAYNKYFYTNQAAQPYSQMYIRDIAKKQSYQITPDNAGTLQIAFSPDGKYLAFAQRESGDYATNRYVDLYLMPFNLSNISQTNPQTAFLQDYNNKVLIHKGFDAQPIFSPDGKSLAFLSNNNDIFNLMTVAIKTTTDQKGIIHIKPGTPQAITQGASIATQSHISWTN